MGIMYDIIGFIQSHGYIALFLVFAIGLFFFPVPNEVLLMSGGLLATTPYIDPVFGMMVIFSSILFHGTSLYMIGHYVGRKPMSLKVETSIWKKRADKGKELLDRYGLKAASFSYFFPFIRHAVPFSVGLSSISYRKFSFIGFSSALVWMNIYYWIGFYYGRTINDWNTFIQHLIYMLAAVTVIVILFQYVKVRRARRIEQQVKE
ncbi:DedA family protein [Bacillus sp. FJAT-45037]|uniref:DedA family protein n=1 Tax=Bacillus sp. FJAT-45037 TaxID=2011007 RepID=UPI000C240814|nr:DedA family protein [Bacillus sp. FJAT-45037]